MNWDAFQTGLEKYATGLFRYLAWTLGDRPEPANAEDEPTLTQLAVYAALCVLGGTYLFLGVPARAVPAEEDVIVEVTYRLFVLATAITFVYLAARIGTKQRPFLASATAILRVLPASTLLSALLSILTHLVVFFFTASNFWSVLTALIVYLLGLSALVIANLPAAFRSEASFPHQRVFVCTGLALATYLLPGLVIVSKTIGTRWG